MIPEGTAVSAGLMGIQIKTSESSFSVFSATEQLHWRSGRLRALMLIVEQDKSMMLELTQLRSLAPSFKVADVQVTSTLISNIGAFRVSAVFLLL